MTPQEIVRAVTQEFLENSDNWRHDQPHTTREINNGLCYEWAEEVLDKLRTSTQHVELWEVPFGCGDATHAVLRIDGLFIDAEDLHGQQDHMNLPLFKKLDRRQPLWCIDCNHAAEIHAKTQTPPDNRRDFSDEEIAAYYQENGVPMTRRLHDTASN